MSDSMDIDDQRRRRVRRNALLLTLLAAMFYIAFIALSVTVGRV